MAEKFTIDRFEGGYAICETEEMDFVNIEKALIPGEAKEGSVIASDDEGRFVIIADGEEQRRNAIREKMNKLWK